MEAALFKNWDLFILGIVIILTAILGFVVYFENHRSPTRKAFLGFALATAMWGIFNYLSYHMRPPSSAFILLKLTIFAVTWQTYYFLKFSISFPREESFSHRKLWRVFQGVVLVVAVLTLTPLVFKDIASISPDGTIAQIVYGPAIPLFGMMSVGLAVAGTVLLLRKTLRRRNEIGKHYRLISVGVLVMFVLIVMSNFVFPVFLGNARYIQFGALFVFPFIILTSYAIVKNRVFNVRVIGAELFVITLLVFSLLQLILSEELSEILLRGGIFLSFVGVGILLIKSVRKEVEQREELQKLSEQLKKANTELEKLSQFKSRMLSMAAHDIKAPLATIKGFASIIMDGIYGPISEKIKETIGKMKSSADELIDMINSLLNLRKIDEGQMDYKFETVKFKDLIQDVVDILKVQAEGKKLAFTFLSGSEGNVSVDPQKLKKEVIQNLIDNAIKYTPQGFVKVETKEEGGYIIFSVSDSGLGISPALLPNLFTQEFVRDERIKREIKGTGLGLYIAKSIVTAHGGTIWAESEGEGKGSKFFVKLRKIN